MKFVYQFGIILFVSFLGEILKYFIHLPIPASIYGLVIMLLLLSTNVLKLEKVKDAGNFLIEIMSLMFIPPGVGLMIYYDKLKDILFPVIITTLLTTVIVMVVTGKVTEIIIHRDKNNNKYK